MRPSSGVAPEDGENDNLEAGLVEIAQHLEAAVDLARQLDQPMLEHFLRMALHETGMTLALELRKGDVAVLQ